MVGDLLTTVRQQPLTATLEPIFRRRAVGACSIPRRLGSAATTLPTPLTIPVNISADQEIIAESGKVEIAQADCVFQVVDSAAADWPDRLATADHLWRDVCIDLVNEALGKERSVELAAPFHQKADQVAPAQLVQKSRERHALIGSGREAQHLGGADPPRTRGGDERVG